MNDSIFVPNYNISLNTTSALEDIERQLWLVERVLLMPKHEAWMRREVQVKRASATTQIEGANLDEEAVSNLLKTARTGRLTEDEQANVNALEAYKFIDYLSDQPDIPIDELVVRQLNRYFLDGAVETLTPGVYRKGLNTVGEFTPPDQGDVPSLMRSFALWLREDNDAMHPIVKAGIAHIHMVTIHPFWDGNGRTARGLATLILQRSPFSFRKLLSLESYLHGVRDQYFNTIEWALGTVFEDEYDASSWLEFFALSLRNHIYEFQAGLTDWHRKMQEVYIAAAEKGWSQRQADGYVFAFQNGRITRSDYMEITGVSPVTASRDLARLVVEGALNADGKTRARIYYPVLAGEEPANEPEAEQLHLLVDG